MEQKKQKNANVLAEERTDLAVERTIMAADRTMMAWVRTGLSLISFGFTIYKFLQAAIGDLKVSFMTAQGPRRFGLLLIALGTLSVIIGAIDYFKSVDRLNKFSEHQYKLLNFSILMGIIIGLLGLFLFITILIHKEVF